MIAVIVPAHNEQKFIGACLKSIEAATRTPALGGEGVQVLVVLDACSDRTEAVARASLANVLEVDARNVGVARAAGARRALESGARWLAFTDADCEVPVHWLSSQLSHQTDAVCGAVEVRRWGTYGARMRRHFAETYCSVDGHRHIHGANLGISARAYALAGGFPPLASSEDVALVEALQRRGASITWSGQAKVSTSARRRFRAPGGFGATLERIHRERSWMLPAGDGLKRRPVTPIDRDRGV